MNETAEGIYIAHTYEDRLIMWKERRERRKAQIGLRRKDSIFYHLKIIGVAGIIIIIFAFIIQSK